MADLDLQILLTSRSEALDVEYKAWHDTSLTESGAKLARHLAALCNHGGGYLIFGVENQTRTPQGPTGFDEKLFGEDAISSIVKRYLDPPFQCRVARVSHEGVEYPIVIVPQHGARPVITLRDGPANVKNKPIGIREGAIYIRAPGPESVAIRRPDDWTALLDRCLGARADILSQIMRHAIGKPARPSLEATDLLKAACEATAASFVEQMGEVVPLAAEKDREWVRHQAGNFAVLGYALTDDDGELVELENLRALNSRADIGMHEYAHAGWSAFLPLRVPERAPQLRTDKLFGADRTYLEGMRSVHSSLLTTFDYWRMYRDGVSCFAEAYREDGPRTRKDQVLVVGSCLVKLHSILAHARLVGQQTPGVGKVVIHQEWKGLKGRHLCWREDVLVTPTKLRDDRFVRTIMLDWNEVRDRYVQALQKICQPFFELFAIAGWTDPETALTKEVIEREFGSLHGSVRLFES